MKIKGIPVGTPMARPDWEQNNPLRADYIKNKPTIPKPDWNEKNPASADYIENKPDFNAKQNKLAWATDDDIEAMFDGSYEGVENEDPEGDGYLPGTGEPGRYNSIEDALNAQNQVTDGKVATHIVGDDLNIILLEDIASATTINITKDCTLHLNGKKLSFTAPGAYLNINTASKVTINGTVAGSEITKNISNGTNEKLVESTGTTLNLVDGTYSMYGTYTTAAIPLRTESGTTAVTMTGCSVVGDVSAPTAIYGTQFKGESKIDKCSFRVSNTSGQATAIRVTNTAPSASINECTVFARSPAVGSRVWAVAVYTNTTINNCHIEADGHGDVDGTVYDALAICCGEADMTINGGYYWGAREAICVLGTSAVRINGGVYTGCQHGGAYFGGTDTKAKNATFRNVKYTGDCGWSSTHYGAVYCGDGSNAANVCFDNCRFESEISTEHAVVAKYTNTKVYLSNSIIDGTFGDDLRADASCVIYVGKNVFYNASKVTDNIDATTNAGKEFGFETEPTNCENLIGIKASLAAKGKLFEHIGTITLDESTNLIKSTLPFACESVFFKVYIAAAGVTYTNGNIAIYCTTATDAYHAQIVCSQYLKASTAVTGYGSLINFDGMHLVMSSYGQAWNPTNLQTSFTVKQTVPIEGYRIQPGSGNDLIPAGSKIEVYGVRA